MSEDSCGQKTWVVVKDGKSIKGNRIDVISLSKILTNIQHAYDNIGQSKYGADYKKEDYKLYIGEIAKGSVVLPLAPLTYSPRIIDEPDPFRKVTACFECLVDSLSSSPNEFRPKLEEEITDPSNRIGVLKSMKFLSQSDSPIHFKTSKKKPSDDGYTISKADCKTIDELLTDYTTPGEMTVHGLMLGFQINKEPYFFTLKTENGRNVRCYFDKNKAEEYHSYFWKWVTVTGNAVATQKGYKLRTVSELSEQKTKKLDSIGDYKLKKPTEFATSYDKEDGIWCLVNEELALYGYGSDYRKTVKCLEECLEGHVLSFTKYPDEEHTDDSIVIKNKLTEYVDFKEVLDAINEKYGDE